MIAPVLPLLLMLGGQASPQQAAPTVATQRLRTPPRLYDEAADARAQIDTALKAATEDDISALITLLEDANKR